MGLWEKQESFGNGGEPFIEVTDCHVNGRRESCVVCVYLNSLFYFLSGVLSFSLKISFGMRNSY